MENVYNIHLAPYSFTIYSSPQSINQNLLNEDGTTHYKFDLSKLKYESFDLHLTFQFTDCGECEVL